MQFRDFRFALAIVAALALCPLLAYAAEPAANSTTPNNPDESLIAAEVIQKVEDTAASMYTDALTLPDDLITNTTVMPAGGILRGSDGDVYYLRETAVDETQEHYAFKTLEMFNTYLGTWETLAPMPQWLTYCSAEMFNGNLVVCGVGYDTSAFAPTSTEYMFMYNPEKGEWSTLNALGVPLGASLVYDGHNLLVVGGGNGSLTAGTAAFVYFPDKGLGDQVATLSTPVLNPQLAAHQESVYVYSYGSTPEDWASLTPAAQHLQVFKDDVGTDTPSKDLTSALPAFVPTDDTGNIRAQVYGSLAATIDGLVIVGPQMEDHAADTYFMSWDGTSFEPYTLRASANQMYGTGACVYSNKLFAAGASIQEDNHVAFRSTTVTAPAVVDGNNAVWQRGSSSLVTMTYNPDISRFSKKVIVDGMLLTLGDEYAYDMGSTVVELASSYLEDLHLGQHEMLTYFDGGGVVVTTYFTTEEAVPAADAAADTNPDGSGKRPMALAKTSDVTLAIPFVILGIGAIGLGIYLVRRKSRSI